MRLPTYNSKRSTSKEAVFCVQQTDLEWPSPKPLETPKISQVKIKEGREKAYNSRKAATEIQG